MIKMNASLVVLVVALSVFVLGRVVSAQDKDAKSAWVSIKAGAQLIDVRTPDEFASGHIAGARNIEYEEITNHLSELDQDKSKPIVLYCGSGFRAGKALKALRDNGYTNVTNAGGYDELAEAEPKS